MNHFYWSVWRITHHLFGALFGVKVIGLENIPATGAIVVASNHQSYFDPPLVGMTINREVHFFAKKELFDIPGLRWLITRLNSIPVRRGVYDPLSLSKVEKALGDGGGLLMFPEGTRGDGEVFLKPKAGVGLIARRYGAAIVPTYVYRSNKAMEALILRRGIRILFGEPILPDEIAKYDDNKHGYRLLAEYVMEKIGELKETAVARFG